MDLIDRFKLKAWFETYYQPDKLSKREENDPGFSDGYLKGLEEDFTKNGRCAISKFDSITGTQIYFPEDPNKMLF